MMKSIIFAAIVICTHAVPLQFSRNDHSETITNQYESNENTESHQAPQPPNRYFPFSTERAPKKFHQEYISRHSITNQAPSLGIKYIHEFYPTARAYVNQPTQGGSQQQGYQRRSDSFQSDQKKNDDASELLADHPISYKAPVPQNEHPVHVNPSQYNFQPVVAPPRNFLQIVTPGPRSLVQKTPSTDQVDRPGKSHSAVSRQFSGDAQIVFPEQSQPLTFYSINGQRPLFPNPLAGQLASQTVSKPFVFAPYQFRHKSNPETSVEAANILYPNGNFARYPLSNVQELDPSVRQIIPAPQEFLNTAITFGNNIFERIPGYRLTSNLVGFLGNVTRLGVNFINTQFPLINPALLNPNQIDIYPNRPIIIPSNDYYPIPTQPTYTTTAYPTYASHASQPPAAASEEIAPAVDPNSSYENIEDTSPQPDNDQEIAYNSQEQELYENPQTSQEQQQDNPQYSQEDQRATHTEQQGSRSKEDHRDTQDQVGEDKPAVAEDILPDEDEFGIGDDDDKIDAKAIKSIVG